ncbi:hypothetical protein [Streptomyces sp. NPDC050564]|uniref:hypothetical protein n=1 Tax=Streptomyces sp. NPDC050564 TaxID=3365631 RepID=UPI0037A6C00C
MRALLVEKHGELSPFPRSRLVNFPGPGWSTRARWRSIANSGSPPKIAGGAFAPEYGRIRFRGTLYDRDFALPRALTSMTGSPPP